MSLIVNSFKLQGGELASINTKVGVENKQTNKQTTTTKTKTQRGPSGCDVRGIFQLRHAVLTSGRRDRRKFFRSPFSINSMTTRVG